MRSYNDARDFMKRSNIAINDFWRSNWGEALERLGDKFQSEGAERLAEKVKYNTVNPQTAALVTTKLEDLNENCYENAPSMNNHSLRG